jgi:hypothetical protein
MAALSQEDLRPRHPDPGRDLSPRGDSIHTGPVPRNAALEFRITDDRRRAARVNPGLPFTCRVTACSIGGTRSGSLGVR